MVCLENTFTLAGFLQKKAASLELPRLRRKAIVQGHCHQKAILRLDDDEAVMKKMALDFQVLDSGCCGMAGAFGYEADKHEISLLCGERVLLPAARNAARSTLILADGFSCREQILQSTARRPLHLAEAMQMALQQTDSAIQIYPEEPLLRRRLAAQQSSMMRAALATGALLAAGVLLWRNRRK